MKLTKAMELPRNYALAKSSSVQSQHDFVDGAEHERARLKPFLEVLVLFTEALERINKKVPDKVSVHEAADMAVEFKAEAVIALAKLQTLLDAKAKYDNI